MEKKIKRIIDTHSKGQCLCENALVEADKLFKSLPNFLHCQTSQEGFIEVILKSDTGKFDNNICILEACRLLKEQSKSSGVEL